MSNKSGSIRDLIIPLSLAMIGAWTIHYFFLGKAGLVAQHSTDFIAPATRQIHKPLNTEIDFIDSERPVRAILTDVETHWGALTFSTNGASLDRLSFKRSVNGKDQLLYTIFPVEEASRENRCFLVGLDQPTPYFYTLQDRQDNDEHVRLIYQAAYDGGIVRKTFVVYKKDYKIDVLLELDPQEGVEKEVELRLLFPSPIIPSMAKNDLISSIVFDNKDVFEKAPFAKLDMQRGWFKPSLFGADTRYFVHAMTADHDSFVERAYYKAIDNKIFISILEGPVTSKKSQWNLSFYFGPKSGKAMAAIDDRLQNTLDYSGILAPISKFLLMILNWLYKYVGNYGFAIIVLTFLIKLSMLPFSWRGQAGMEKQKEFQKKLAYIQQKYKNNPEALKQEKEELIRKHGLPGMGSCLPLLMQMPIFFALSRLLSSSIELYGAPMLWIQDLSAPDPYYILPILVSCVMLAQAATMDSQQRTTFIAMAFVFGAFASTMSAGLALYIVISTFLGVLQVSATQMFKRG